MPQRQDLERVALRPESFKHGTNYGYSLGCRCAACTQNHRDYMREWWLARSDIARLKGTCRDCPAPVKRFLRCEPCRRRIAANGRARRAAKRAA